VHRFARVTWRLTLGEGIYSFNGDFGRFDYRKNVVAFFETTLSETIFSIVPARRFRILALIAAFYPIIQK
jgi:hypothetical protein